jgi:ABC-type dipeptide/oligopeptide/nickel transport system permease subunit
VLGTSSLAVIARMSRSSMLEVLREDYMRTARAKGLSPWRVVVVHGLRNALMPVLTVIGLQTGSLLAGAVLTETIFSWPGIGKWLIEAIARRDYPVVQTGILMAACTFIAVNLVVDLLYGVVNPRIRGRHEHDRDFRRAGAGRLGRWQARLAAARDFTRAFTDHRGAVLALAVLALIGLAVLLAPGWRARPGAAVPRRAADATGLARRRQARFPLGTDELGRDILSRLLWGGRISLGIGLASVLLSLLPGVLLGLLAVHPRWLAPAVMRVMDVMLALPGLLLAICVITVLGPGRSTPCWRSPSARCRAMCA